MSDDAPLPTAAQVKAWMKNHTNVPLAGLPKRFIDKLTEAADGRDKPKAKENTK